MGFTLEWLQPKSRFNSVTGLFSSKSNKAKTVSEGEAPVTPIRQERGVLAFSGFSVCVQEKIYNY